MATTMDGLGLSWLQRKKRLQDEFAKEDDDVLAALMSKEEEKEKSKYEIIERLPDHLPGYTNDNSVLVTAAQIDGIKQMLL